MSPSSLLDVRDVNPSQYNPNNQQWNTNRKHYPILLLLENGRLACWSRPGHCFFFRHVYTYMTPVRPEHWLIIDLEVVPDTLLK